MAKSTWSDVSKGDRVKVNGREFTVAKIKPKGKKARVVLESPAGKFPGEVRLKDPVKIVAGLRAKDGAMNRWASKSEAKRDGVRPMHEGDSDVTKPPQRPSTDPWETRRDRVERALDDVLGARLVGEATDESQGYYCPPVDITTVAAHLALYHGVNPSELDDEKAMLTYHAALHVGASDGSQPMKVNHWHTETRPKAAA